MGERYFALLKNGIVQNVIVASEAWVNNKSAGEWIETFRDTVSMKFAAIGDKYNSETGDFEAMG